jgi:hypothetical protein
MIWNKICAGGKLPKNGEKVLVSDGTTWDVGYFHKHSVDAIWFDSLVFETEEIKAWSRVEMPVK